MESKKDLKNVGYCIQKSDKEAGKFRVSVSLKKEDLQVLAAGLLAESKKPQNKKPDGTEYPPSVFLHINLVRPDNKPAFWSSYVIVDKVEESVDVLDFDDLPF